MANPGWWDLFLGFRVSHLQHNFSDHCPVLVDTEGDGRLRFGEQQRHFRFNADWILQSDFEKGLVLEWNSNHQDFLVNLREVGFSLSSWAAKSKKFRERRTLELNTRLSELSACEISDEVLEEITEVKLALNLEANKEEIFWEQRAIVNWLRMRDRNTSFFHRCASNRKKRNVIRGLLNGAGTWVTDFGKVLKIATDYFKDLFPSTETGDCDRLFVYFVPCITDDLNRDLMVEFKAEEIVVAMKSIGPLKASGRDKFPALFFKNTGILLGRM